jgi:hypothetical protein
MIRRLPKQRLDFLGIPLPADNRHEKPNSLPLPTWDERVNLYLNAVYGPREFTEKERTEACNVLLDEIASNIDGRDPKSPGFRTGNLDPPTDRPEIGVPRVGRAAAASRSFKALPDIYASVRETNERSFANMKIELANAKEEFLHYKQQSEKSLNKLKADLARAHKELLHYRKRQLATAHGGYDRSHNLNEESESRGRGDDFQPKPISRKIKSVIPAFAAIAASLIIAAIVVFPSTRFGTDKRSSEMKLALKRSAANRQSTHDELLKSKINDRFDSQQIVRLLKLGNELITNGSITGGRAVLKEAADAGSAAAALTLGATFDPNEIAKQIKTSAPRAATEVSMAGHPESMALDIAKARYWYEKARGLGSTEAAERLNKLSNSKPQPPAR